MTASCKSPQDLNPDKQILSFTLTGVLAENIRIDDSAGSVEVVVSYGTILSDLIAQIEISPQATIVPSVSTPQDFTRPVYYTVSAADGSKKVYTVHVLSAKQGRPVITGFSVDSVRAGGSFIISGNDFGHFGSAVKTLLIDSAGQEFAVSCTLIDSVRIGLTVPVSTNPGSYQVQVIKNSIGSNSTGKMWIKIPAPEITAIKVSNIIPGDSVILAGNYILPQRYDYRLKMEGKNGSRFLTPAVKENGKLIFKTDQNFTAGLYSLFLINIQEVVTSERAAETLRIYDSNLPFVKGIKNARTDYTPSESLALLTNGFEKLQTRFYQIRLRAEGVDYNINGIYSGTEKLLSFSLPLKMKQGSYAIAIFFMSDSGQQLYDIDLDELLTIK